MGTKIKLSPTTLFLLIVNLRPKSLKKTSVIETVKEVIQSLGSIRLKWQRKTKIKLGI